MCSIRNVHRHDLFIKKSAATCVRKARVAFTHHGIDRRFLMPGSYQKRSKRDEGRFSIPSPRYAGRAKTTHVTVNGLMSRGTRNVDFFSRAIGGILGRDG